MRDDENVRVHTVYKSKAENNITIWYRPLKINKANIY